MSEYQSNNAQVASNPFQASALIFFKPKAVFDALFNRDNWSWVPFFMLSIVLFMPGYMFFKVVDFDYWVSIFVQIQSPGASPKELENAAAGFFPLQMQFSYALLGVLATLMINLVIAAYYSFITRNDEKSIHSYSDWFGAMWWCAMPSLLSGLLSILLISLYEPNVQTFGEVMMPLSVAFFAGIDPLSAWYSLAGTLRIDYIWSVFLGFVLLRSWTEFALTKAAVLASIPFVLAIVYNVIVAMF